MGRLLIASGVVLILMGLMALLAERSGLRPGRLPGDIVYQGKNSTFYIPIVSSLVLSAVLSLVFWLIRR